MMFPQGGCNVYLVIYYFILQIVGKFFLNSCHTGTYLKLGDNVPVSMALKCRLGKLWVL